MYAQGNQQTHDVALKDNSVENQDKEDQTDATDSHLEDSVEFSAFELFSIMDHDILMRVRDNSFQNAQ